MAAVPSRKVGVNGQLKKPSTEPNHAALLAKMDEANRLLEADRRSHHMLSPNTSKKHSNGNSGHSRQGSISSLTSASSNMSGLDEATSPEELWTLWGRIVTDWENIMKKKPNYIKELVRKGIPHHFRGIVWQLLCSVQNCPTKDQYADFLKMTSPCEKVIRRDITRTYPEHDFFKEKNGLGQESLFNVIKAYSLQDREVGYCQGSGFIVGLLLMQMPEEEAFAVLVKIMQEYRLRELFKPTMADLGLCMFQLECMIQDQLPQLYAHFQAQTLCVSMFASSWFLTLFTTSLPLSVACRIFDVFLSEGMEIIFKIGFSILQLSEEELLTLDMEGMLQYLQKDMPSVVEHDMELVLSTAYQVKYNAKKMKKLEKEYNALKSKEQEEQVELRRLRTENRLLRQRIDNLEKETSALADRLIQDQVKYAQQEEEIFVLRRDLSAVKQHDQSALHKLNQVSKQFEEYKRSNSSVSGGSQESLQEEKIDQLEKQLKDIRQRENESIATICQLRDKLKDLENANQQLQKEPETEVQRLQEELIACKLREAEANLSMKELRQKVYDLDKHWQKYLEKANAPGNGKPSKAEMRQLQDDLMAMRIREAEAVGELKEMKQKVMELETTNHICDRQIKRLDAENDKLKEKLEEADNREKDLHNQLKEQERKGTDRDSKQKETSVLSRIRDAEHAQTVAEMRRRIAELEIENQELVTAGQLQVKGDREDLENKIVDLQEEVLQLKMARRLQSLSQLALNSVTTDTESEAEDLESSRLRLPDTVSLDAVRSCTPNELHSSDADTSESQQDNVKRKTSRKKKKCLGRKPISLDFDKTPTQDTFDTNVYLLDNHGRMENGTESDSKSDHHNAQPDESSNSQSDVDGAVTELTNDKLKQQVEISE